MSKCVNCLKEINEKEVFCLTCHEEVLECAKNQIANLEAKLAESEKLTERLQQIVNKLRDKEFAGKTLVEAVNAVYEPLYKNKYDEAEELKQQLAESEADKKALISDYESRITKHQELMSWLKHNNEELKQQLAEKDKEISNLNGLVRERDKQIKNLKTNKKRVIEHKNKTKISFVVEKLVGVQKYISDNAVYLEEESFGREINDYIDNQIASLKKEMK